jgi:hypothetical protein
MYILQGDKFNLCWQIKIQPLFLCGFNNFLHNTMQPNKAKYWRIIKMIITIDKFIKTLNSEENILLNPVQDIIRRIFIYYQTGFQFSIFDDSFYYWIAKMIILLVIFTHKDVNEIRLVTVNTTQLTNQLISKAEKSLNIPKYSVILDVNPSEVITHFLRLRQKRWKSSTFIFARSISGLCLDMGS